MGSYPLPPGFTPQGNLNGGSSGTLYQQSQTSQSVQVLSGNAFRNGVFFFNKTNVGNALVAFSTTASLNAFTVSIPPSASWYAPYPTYVGPVSVTWDSVGSGKLMVTETS